jgi:RND family efflux transporter MFP subunit
MVRSALANPHAVAVAALALLVVAMAAFPRMGIDMLPTFRTPAVQVLTFYPGMPAEHVEQDITTRLERWTGQANGVARQESKSMVGVSIVKDFFRPDIDPNTALSMVSALAISDLYYLPPGTVPPMVMPFDPTATTPLAVITVSSPTADEARLYDVAYFELRNRLQAVSGVIAPAVYGGKLRRILAYVDPDRLHARGLSPLDVITAIRAQNVLVPTGSAAFGDIDYMVNTNSMVERVSEIDRIPIRVDEANRPVFVGDVAEARDASAIQTNIVRIDGRRQVYIPIYRQPGANTLAIVDAIRGRLDEIQARLPADIQLDLVMDQSETVRADIRHLLVEGLLGALLAAATVLVFLRSVRSTLVAVTALPLALVAGVLGLFLLGQTLNSMTLGGLALAVGLVIDQAIVVIENVERRLSLGEPPAVAALEGAREVAQPVLVIVVTIAAVFFPVLFLTGMGKLLFSALALAVIATLSASYVVAMTVVPVMAALLLRAHAPDRAAPDEDAESGWFSRVRSAYVRLLDVALRRRAAVAALCVALLALALLAAPMLGTELFPPIDSGQVTVRLRAQSGLRIERTEEIVAEVEALVSELVPEEERVKVISNIGVLLDWPAAYTPNSGPMDAFVQIQLAAHRSSSAQEYVERLRPALRERFPGVEFALDAGGLVTSALTFGLPSPLNIQIEGKDLEAAGELAEEIRGQVAVIPGAVDVRVQQRKDYPQIGIEVDRVKAAEIGLTQEQVVKNIVAALNSSINFLPSFWFDPSNGNHYFLGVQYREEDIESLETLRNLPITGANTESAVLLRNIASFRRYTAPTEVNHLDISRVTDVYANVSGRDIGSVAADIEQVLGGLQVPAGLRAVLRGEVETMRTSFGEMGLGLVLGAVLVYLVMVALFRSWLDPLAILSTVPLGLSGVVAALLVTGSTVNIMSLMGAVMTIGIGVSYSILYVDFANRRVADGAAIHDAIREAGRTRLRPILMTSAAAVLGMVPMAISAGQSTTPLARAVIGGLLASTALTLVVLPCAWTALREPRRWPALGRDLRPMTASLLALLLVSTSAGCGAGAQQEPEATGVTVTRPVRRDITRKLTLTGSLEAWQDAKLFAKVSGYVRELHFDRGDRVEEGAVLAVLHVPEIDQEAAGARADQQAMEAAAAEAKAALARLEGVRARSPGAVSDQELDAAQAAQKTAEARLGGVAAEVGRLWQMRSFAKVVAPFDGVVTDRYVDLGDFVATGTQSTSSPVARVVDMSKLRAVIDVPEPDSPHAIAGHPATVRVDALPGRTFQGVIARRGEALDPKTRTMRIEVDLDNAEGALVAGMSASVTLDLEARTGVVSLAPAVVRFQREKPYVLTVVDGVCRDAPVVLGADDGTAVEIVSGLDGSELVVADGPPGLKAGASVRVTGEVQ